MDESPIETMSENRDALMGARGARMRLPGAGPLRPSGDIKAMPPRLPPPQMSPSIATAHQRRLVGAARPRRPVSLRAGGGGLSAGGSLGGPSRGPIRRRDGKRVGERRLAHTSHGFASTSCLAVLPISSEIERDEQDEVRAENADARDGGELLPGALAHVGEVGDVSRGEVGVRGEVDEAWVSG